MTATEQRLVDGVVAAVGRREVLLCGSRAIGNATPTSDYDLLVTLPLPRIPFAVRRLARLSDALSNEVGVPVTISPLPARALRRRPQNLFTWKIRREARRLAGTRAVGAVPAVPSATREARLSYLASALWYLLDDCRGGVATPSRGEEKARLHLAQLRLLDRGEWASSLEDAVAAAGDARLREPSWLATRELVLESLRPLLAGHTIRRSLVVNVRYALLSALRGRMRIAYAASPHPVDVTLVRCAAALAGAVEAAAPDAQRRLDEAIRLLPAAARPAARSWEAALDAARREWPSAHPLLAQ